MIYLVSQNKSLFNSTRSSQVPFDFALSLLNELEIIQLDTETTGLDEHTKQLLTIQLGNKRNQVVFDWTTLTKTEKYQLKIFLENKEKLFLGWNLAFDLRFLYAVDIWPQHIWDGMIAQQLIWLGIDITELIHMFIDDGKDPQYASYSLKSACMNYLNIDLDKTVRGKIINEGLTEEVVVYAAGDVMWIEDIKDAQDKILDEQELQSAMYLECEFLKGLAYFQYCGAHLDVNKWKAKMDKDLAKMQEAEQKLNDWVIDWESKQEDGYELRYPELELEKEGEEAIQKLTKQLLREGYIRYPQEDLAAAWSTYNQPIAAYRRRIQGSYTTIERQGDLFNGFDSSPKCTINWRSPAQIIPFFKKLGIKTETFDKKTKKKKDSIDKTVLKPQAHLFPIIPIYLEYRKAAQLVSNFGQNWLDAINPKTGRVHPELHSIGTDTSRVSSGGGQYDLNLQNLPHDPETRACFTAERGNVWISADYQSQESRLIASVANDTAMIDLFENGCGDVHSLVAKMSYPNDIPRDLPVEEVKAFSKNSVKNGGIDYRQDAKGIEFAINYGGDANTIANNKGIPLAEAEEIYNNFMKGFPGVATYQEYCRMAVMRDGYILMNPQTRHRAHIAKWPFMKYMMQKMKDPEFWDYYREMKVSAPNSDTVKNVREFFKIKSQCEKNSINYRIQNRGAMCFKLSSIKLFRWICENNYQNIVKMCVPAHDEFNLECPEPMKEDVANKLIECMVEGAKPFCKRVYLGADVDINDHWVH